MRKILTGLVIAGVLGGCASAPPLEQEGAAVEERAPSVEAPAPPPAKPVDPSAVAKPVDTARVAVDPLRDPANILSKRTVYFDFDSNIIKDEYKPVVAAHAKYLMQNRGTPVRVEGNTDERGSREYNLALGQRRAEAVKQMMQLLGVPAGQIEAVSFGEEKPVCAQSEESCWQQNRRSDIRYPGE
jgi:peptidoglycan-associated lipoprotein